MNSLVVNMSNRQQHQQYENRLNTFTQIQNYTNSHVESVSAMTAGKHLKKYY